MFRVSRQLSIGRPVWCRSEMPRQWMCWWQGLSNRLEMLSSLRSCVRRKEMRSTTVPCCAHPRFKNGRYVLLLITKMPSRCRWTLKGKSSWFCYRPRTYVWREVMFSQVCVCSEGGFPGLRFSGGRGGPRSQIFGGGVPGLRFLGGGGGSQVSDFQGGVPGLRFWGGGTQSQ